MALSHSLSGLSEREAVADALYRCIQGFDYKDNAMFESAVTKDAVMDLGGRVMTGLDVIHAECFDPITKLDTTHITSNVRVDVKEGDTKASMTASGMAQHHHLGKGREPDEVGFLTGALYELECVKDKTDGLWKIKYFKLKIVWSQGDRAVIFGNRE